MTLATSSLVLREPTPQEREERRAYLWQRNGMDAWLVRIEAMPDSEAKAGERAKWELNCQSLEREVASGRIAEWVTTYRELTGEELAQRETDQAIVAAALAEGERRRQQRIELVRQAAAALNLLPAEYLELHPVAGVSAEDYQ
ncbi:MAG: hypothetical protein KF821_08985 [Anaerolineales bacterium]|nr:hypothetical protein [Anaerolineales bacterium]